jgi:hypothetical protein
VTPAVRNVDGPLGRWPDAHVGASAFGYLADPDHFASGRGAGIVAGRYRSPLTITWGELLDVVMPNATPSASVHANHVNLTGALPLRVGARRSAPPSSRIA